MGGMFLLGYLPGILGKNKSLLCKIVSLFFLLLGIAPLLHLAAELDELVMRYGSDWTDADIVFGVMFIVSLLEATRRCFGLAMPIIGLLALTYVLFGDRLPATMFGHAGFNPERVVSYMFGPDAIFGEIMTVFVNVVYVYMLFGSLLNYSGATNIFIDFATGLAGHWRGGPAKIAVISSALLGTISGNAVANVATTGAVTIPLMKRTGYKNYFAGAVEAVASTGGQILPPVMGSAAFIMAEFLSISYAEVAAAAAIPALLYFLAVFFMVDLEAVRLGLSGLEKSEIPNLKKVLKEGGLLFVPLFILLYQMLIVRASVAKAGMISCLAILICAMPSKVTRLTLKKLVYALMEAAKDSVGIAFIIASAGLIVGAVGMTGLGTRFSSVLLSTAGNNVYLAGFFTALMCLILGMGLPTTAAYVISVTVAVTTLLRLNVAPLAAHLFVFYFAAISTITPPVAASAYTAAAISGATMWKTGGYATMLGVSAYIIPFIFLTSPELLMRGDPTSVIIATITAIIGLASVAMGFEGVCFVKGIRWSPLSRVLFVFSALWLIIPGVKSDLIGLAIIATGMCCSKDFWNYFFGKNKARSR